MAGWLLASTWCALLVGAALDAPLAATCLACAALVGWARPRARVREAPLANALCFASGFAALPAWLAAIALAGRALGLPPPAPPPAPGPGDAIALVVLAPLLEEWLYRERLLPALRRRLGAPLALVLASAAFAAPHLAPWSVLAAFAVGLALGALFLATGRAGPCVAAHAGLNAAALVCGLPPARFALAPAPAALAACGVLACAWASTRVHAHAPGRRAPARSAEARGLHGGPAWPRSGIRVSWLRWRRSASSSRRAPPSPTESDAPPRSTRS
jgi:membrane protease YdiL (CAAX protease family)